MRMLSIRIRNLRARWARAFKNWCVHWSYESGTGVCIEHTHQILIHAQSGVPLKHAEHTHQELMRTPSIRISSLRVCSACAPETKCCIALSRIEIISYIFTYHTKSPTMRTLWCKNQENPSNRISHAWAPLRCGQKSLISTIQCLRPKNTVLYVFQPVFRSSLYVLLTPSQFVHCIQL
jgi:hypothetical protein